MNRRIRILFLVGGALLLIAFLIVQNFDQVTARYARWERRRLYDRRLGDYEKECLVRMSHPSDDLRSQTAALELQLIRHLRSKSKVADIIRLEDGIDQFEAWLLTWYFKDHEIGSCTDLGAPVRDGSNWITKCWIGRGGERMASISVDAASGEIKCDGYPSLSNIPALIQAIDKNPALFPLIQLPDDEPKAPKRNPAL